MENEIHEYYGKDDGTYDKIVSRNKYTGKIINVLEVWSRYPAVSIPNSCKGLKRFLISTDYHNDGTVSTYKFMRLDCPSCGENTQIIQNLCNQKCKYCNKRIECSFVL